MNTGEDGARAAMFEELSPAKQRLLEQRLRSSRQTEWGPDHIHRREPSARVPLAPEQQSIWLHSRTVADRPLYNEAVTIHRVGSFDLDVMQASLSEIVRRHEAWRTSFHEESGEIVQVVHLPSLVPLPLTDLSELPEEAREAEAVRLATQDATVPIGLDGASLLRARVIRMSEEDHRVHLTLHHIIFDGVSMYRIFMPELAEIYAAFAAGREPMLAELPLQYGDFALWRHATLQSPKSDRQLRSWQERLSGELRPLKLPTDRLRPREISHRGAMERFGIPAGLIERLRALGRSQSATLYMVLLAAFKVLLFRYSGQEDVIVGGTTDMRRTPELEGLMGYFLNTFATRTRPAAGKEFSSYLDEVRDAVLEALDGSEIPFDRIVQAVRPPRESTQHPIFQVFFSIEPPTEAFAEGWDLTQMDVSVGAAKFDLYLELDERPEGMAARFIYSTDLFDASTIKRMAEHWCVLLESICDAPHCALGTLPWLTAEEQGQLTRPGGWNDTAAGVPDGSLPSVIAAKAAESPKAIAVIAGESLLSYEALMTRAAAIASTLRVVDVTRGSIVAVLLDRSIDLLAGMLGVLMAGAAYLPLDPKVPSARLLWSLSDAQPKAVLTRTDLLSTLPPTTASLVLVDQVDATSDVSQSESVVDASPEDTAYLIHTSGTTGQPKAVEITHRSLVNLLASMAREPGFDGSDTLLAVTTVSFDIAALELFLPLLAGGRVVIASAETAQDPFLLAAAIESSGCTVFQATPSTWRALLASGWRPTRQLRALCGGEVMPPDLARDLLALGLELWNMYGPTETTIWSLVQRVERGADVLPIGRPIANTAAFVLDQQRQLLPVGVTGELYLAGTGLAKGYRSQPTLTAERFVFSEALGSMRLYRTGDLAVRHPDGTLVCLGRIDHQVKVRGFRVELGAVEAAVMQHPDVSAAAARTWPDPHGGMRLSVYVKGREGRTLAVAALRQLMATTVPDYMVPSDFVVVEKLPLTHNGKVDRDALPPPTGRELDMVIQPASNVYEQRLCAIWQDLLQLSELSVTENFFEVGGHSLLIATLQQRIHKDFGYRVAMAALFQAPTVQGQALLLQTIETQRSSTPGLLALQPLGAKPALFWLHPPPRIGNLATALGPDQPLFGISLTEGDLQGFAGEVSIPEIAACHVKTIRAVQPHGPYLLAGLCTGGIVAFETALQLEASGEEVQQLILVDAQNPKFYRRIDRPAIELNKTWFYLKRLFERDGDSSRVTFRQRLRDRFRKIFLPLAGRPEMVEGERVTDAAAYQYCPSPLNGSTLLLQPLSRPTQTDHHPGWKTVVRGRLLAQDVQGHHDELLELRNVASVAEAISRTLADASDARHVHG